MAFRQPSVLPRSAADWRHQNGSGSMEERGVHKDFQIVVKGSPGIGVTPDQAAGVVMSELDQQQILRLDFSFNGLEPPFTQEGLGAPGGDGPVVYRDPGNELIQYLTPACARRFLRLVAGGG